jgi:hypothetical protein
MPVNNKPKKAQTLYPASERRRMRWELKLAIYVAFFGALSGLTIYWGTVGLHDGPLASKPKLQQGPTLNLDDVFVGGGAVGMSLPGNSPVRVNSNHSTISGSKAGIEVRDVPASATPPGNR